MKKNLNKKGFTLIELLIVVSIIGVLTTIIISSIGRARDRTLDAKIKSTLTQARTQAEIQYLNNSSYSDLCDDGSDLLELFIEAHNLGGDGTNVCADIDSLKFGGSGGGLVNQINQNWSGSDSNGSIWAMAVKLNGNGWFCIDSLGSALVSSSNTRPITGGDKTC